MQEYKYWQRQGKKPLFPDVEWNIPEQKTGAFLLLGGNVQGFSGVMKDTEYLASNYPVKSAKLLLPEALKSKLPFLENVIFAPATESGSFASSVMLTDALEASDFAILPGELSKNSATAVAMVEALAHTTTPVALAGDAIDAVVPEAGRITMREDIILIGSLMQMQKFLHAMYYPKMLMLSMPLMAVVEILHKFTLSYPGITIVTLHEGQVIVAHEGKIITQNIEETRYTPMTLWFSTLICDIAAMNFYNPKGKLESTSFALLK